MSDDEFLKWIDSESLKEGLDNNKKKILSWYKKGAAMKYSSLSKPLISR